MEYKRCGTMVALGNGPLVGKMGQEWMTHGTPKIFHVG